MTTFAPDRDHLHKLHEVKTQQAWAAYRESTLGLEGPEYVDAEQRSWDRLQRRLTALERELEEGLTTGL